MPKVLPCSSAKADRTSAAALCPISIAFASVFRLARALCEIALPGVMFPETVLIYRPLSHLPHG